MDAFLRQHSALVREQDPAEEVVLPVPVPAALHAVLERMPGYATAAPPRWQDVLRLHKTHTLHPTLFAGLDAPALAELRTVLDFYALPKAWSEWTEQEAAARAGPGNPFHTPSALTPIVTAACGAARRALSKVSYDMLWQVLWGGGPLPPFDPLHPQLNLAVWGSAARVPHAPPRSENEYALYVALGSRSLVGREAWAAVPGRALAAIGDVDGLRWARAAGCPLDEQTCAVAANNGRLAALQWLVTAVGCRLINIVVDAAAEAGHLDVVQWARGKGCPWTEITCAAAAASGRLPVLQWLVEAGCPWDSRTCRVAATLGHLEVLQWSRAHGCAWDSSVSMAAANCGHVDVVAWLMANGCPWHGADLCKGAVRSGHVELLRWLKARGDSTFQWVCVFAVRHDVHAAVLQELETGGCLCPAGHCPRDRAVVRPHKPQQPHKPRRRRGRGH